MILKLYSIMYVFLNNFILLCMLSLIYIKKNPFTLIYFLYIYIFLFLAYYLLFWLYETNPSIHKPHLIPSIPPTVIFVMVISLKESLMIVIFSINVYNLFFLFIESVSFVSSIKRWIHEETLKSFIKAPNASFFSNQQTPKHKNINYTIN